MAKNKYVGHRYVPKIEGEWDKTKSYESLTIVQYQGASYTSRQNVPVGIEITNEEFWVLSGNYNAQVESYRQDVINLENDVSTQLALKATIQDKTITINIPSDYPDLQSAVDDLSTRKHKQGVVITLKIETGHKLTNGVKVQDGDYGHFHIESVDPIVYLDTSFPPSESIVEGNRAVMPTLACVVDGQGLYGQNGYYARNNSRGYVEENCGVRNIKGNNSYSPDMYGIGLMCEASEVYAYKSVFSGNRINLWVTRTSRVFADTSDFKNAKGEHGVFASRSSLLSISGSIVTGCAVNALTVYRSIVTAVGSTNLSNAGSKCINSASGSTVIINQRHSATPNISNSDYGIYAHSSKIIADNAIIDGNRYGVYAEKNSHVNVDGSTITNSTEVGIKAEESSYVYALGVVVKNSTVYNVQARFLSQVNLKDATTTGAGTKDIFVEGASTVFARGCTTTNTTTAGRPNVLDTNTFASDGGFDTFHKNKGVIWTANPHNKGVGKNVPVTAEQSSIEVVFSVEEDTNSYAIHVTPNWNTVCWVTNKTVNGFTINFGTPPTTNRTLDWIMKK